MGIFEYRAGTRLPAEHRLWPLRGKGFESLGPAVAVAMPICGPGELLVRHDAVGICFSDVKVVRAGAAHPRVGRDLATDPVVLGHEVALTVVGVGERLRGRYAVGDRFVVQADITVDGAGMAYGYRLPGGLAQYAVLDHRVLPFLVAVAVMMGYAPAALHEPWACVEAAYGTRYRSAWRTGGTAWLTGDGRGARLGAARDWLPATVHLDVADTAFAREVTEWAATVGAEVIAGPPSVPVDDIVVFGDDPERAGEAFGLLADGGVGAVVSASPRGRVRLDLGRLHYDRITVAGTTEADLSCAYRPIRGDLRPGGRTWVLGAGGPLGRMHVQRALALAERPAVVVATNRRAARMSGLTSDGVTCLSEDDTLDLRERLRLASGGGFDDVVVVAASAAAAESALEHVADGAVVNVFAGVPRGTGFEVDVDLLVRRGVRFAGTSGSSVGDLLRVRDLAQAGMLRPAESVSAVAGFDAVPQALRAVADGVFAGKVVVFPQLVMPLTPVEDWSLEAETALFQTTL